MTETIPIAFDIAGDIRYIKDYIFRDIDWDYQDALLWPSEPGARVLHDLEVAKGIHGDHIRNIRSTMFDQLDVDFMIAQEDGNHEAWDKVVATKRILRGAPQHELVMNAPDLETLAKVTLDDIVKFEEAKAE